MASIKLWPLRARRVATVLCAAVLAAPLAACVPNRTQVQPTPATDPSVGGSIPTGPTPTVPIWERETPSPPTEVDEPLSATKEPAVPGFGGPRVVTTRPATKANKPGTNGANKPGGGGSGSVGNNTNPAPPRVVRPPTRRR